MPTETQKNFIKQMESYKKESASKNEAVFSYIEKDIITDYYMVKSKRRYRKSMSIATIVVVILIIGLKLYGYREVLLLSTPIGIQQLINVVVDTGNVSPGVQNIRNEKMQEVAIFLKNINDIRNRQNDTILQYNKAVSDYRNGIITQKGLLIKIEDLKNQVDMIKNDYNSVDIAKGMDIYYDLVNENLLLQNSLFEELILQHKAGNSSSNGKIKVIIEKLAASRNEIENELLRKFDELGIQYNIDSEGGITYTIQY